MAAMKYSDRIVTDARPLPSEIKQNGPADLEKQRDIKFTHLMNVDAGRFDDFFYVDAYCLWSGASQTPVEVPHTHDFSEVLCFVGTNEDDPYDLGGEVTVWLDDDRHVINKTSLIYLPPGTRHCPMIFNRVDRPMFFITIAPTGAYSRTAVGNDAISTAPKDGDKPRYTIISHTKEKTPAPGQEAPPAPPPGSKFRGSRILHLEDDMVAGSFYVDFVWVYEGSGAAPAPAHDHDWPELLAMAGCDPEHPHDLGGLMTIDLDGEVYETRKSNLVCIPAHVMHCPWKYIDFVKPTLIFTASPSALYYSSSKDKW